MCLCVYLTVCGYRVDREGLLGRGDVHLIFTTGTRGRGLRSIIYKVLESLRDIHGHRTLKAPHPVRSAKLTRVPLS